jgi:hypothetical protein
MGHEAARLPLNPAWYRVRCCQAGLDGASDAGGNCSDWYRIQIWPAQPGPVRVLKRALGSTNTPAQP